MIEVQPGDPRYPESDTAIIPGGLSLREGSAVETLTKFYIAIEILMGLAQHLPGLANPEAKEGTVEFADGDICKVLKRMLGFPGVLAEPFSGVTPRVFWAATDWAFNRSNYWPTRLKTLDDVIDNWHLIKKQYDSYYDKVPEGKRPHHLDAGSPFKSNKLMASHLRHTAFDDEEDSDAPVSESSDDQGWDKVIDDDLNEL